MSDANSNSWHIGIGYTVPVRRTRFAELGYAKVSNSEWRFVATEDGKTVGPRYASKAELLADLTRYATEYGCQEGAAQATEVER